MPHGNRDADKDSLRKDSANAQFACIRLLLSLAALFHFSLAAIDISGAYLQEGKVNRDIYMRPPPGWTKFIDEIWKIVKPAYGLFESGRLWQLCIEEWLNRYGFDTIPGLPQFFVLRNNACIVLLLVKVVDDLLLTGLPHQLERFYSNICKRFKVGRFITGKKFIFYRLHIVQTDDKSVTVSMEEFFRTVQPIQLSKARCKQHDDVCTAQELKELQSLAGKLNFLGHGVLPPAALVASLMQQNVGNLRVHHLKEANAALHHLKSLTPQLHFRAPPVPMLNRGMKGLSLLSFSDASTEISSYRTNGLCFWFVA